MIKPEFLDINSFVTDKNVLRLFDAVSAYGGVMRFVGGAVRDAIAGLKGFDFDLATDLSPEELVEACQEAGLKTVPIGLKFATTGVIINNKVFEVSSLHHGQNTTDAEFTDDWNADASCRDLTINAIYADNKGNVFDYYNGLSDLEEGIIRFIGNPEDRIKEHPIRIMRFFRFYALFGKGNPDEKSLQACIDYKNLLKEAAIEQVRDELFKILATRHPARTLNYIFDHDILSYIFPTPQTLTLLENLSNIVDRNNQLPDALRRLFMMYTPDEELAENLATRLHLNKNQKKRLVNWAKFDLDPNRLTEPEYLAAQIYRCGRDFCRDKVLFLTTEGRYPEEKYFETICAIDAVRIPEFPIKGSDLIELGITEQNKIGEVLDILKFLWIKRDFVPSRTELLAEAEEIMQDDDKTK